MEFIGFILITRGRVLFRAVVRLKVIGTVHFSGGLQDDADTELGLFNCRGGLLMKLGYERGYFL